MKVLNIHSCSHEDGHHLCINQRKIQLLCPEVKRQRIRISCLIQSFILYINEGAFYLTKLSLDFLHSFLLRLSGNLVAQMALAQNMLDITCCIN